MNFQGYLEDTYKLIKEEPLILIGGGFLLELLLLLSQGTLFLITGPLLGGYLLLIILALRENKKPAFNDIFSGLYQFRNLLPYTLVVLIIFIGLALFIIPGLIFATWWIYVLPLMVDRKISYSKAMGLSMTKVNETGFFMHLVFLLLITFIPLMFFNFIAATMPFLVVTSVLYPPFLAGCLVCLYLDQFKEIEEKIDEEQTETSVAEKPLTQPFEEEADAEAGKEIHPDDAKRTSEDPTMQNTISGQPNINENSVPEQPEKESGPDSGDIAEKTDGITGKNNKEDS
jgi:hypothetical protein